MLQINTKSNAKSVEIDGLGYKVRKPGAGESLTLQKSGREITNLAKVSKLTDAQSAKLQDLTVEVLGICLSLFEGNDKAANLYIEKLDVETLLDIINQVYEPENATPASTAKAA